MPARRLAGLLSSLSLLSLLGCATAPDTAPASSFRAPTGYEVRQVRSMQDDFTGEVSGLPGPNSRFQRIAIGMSLDEVYRTIGQPDRLFRLPSGNNWLQTRLGTAPHRIVAVYQGVGCLSAHDGGLPNTRMRVLRIDFDTEGKCAPAS